MSLPKLLPDCRICKAATFEKQIKERLHNMKIVERCACTKSPIALLHRCEICKDKGWVSRDATLKDLIKAMETPTNIFIEDKK